MDTQRFFKTASFFLMAVLWQTSNASAEPMTSSLSKLIASGQSVVCTYQTSDANGSQKGTIYVTQNQMRGDIDVTSPDGTFPMHMIREGEWMYTWGGPMGEAQGMKMKVPPPGAAGPGRTQGPDMNETINMDCNPWPVDANKFSMPSNVEFMDLGAAMGGMGAAGIDMKAIQCGACEQAPPEERDQCRQVLGCSP